MSDVDLGGLEQGEKSLYEVKQSEVNDHHVILCYTALILCVTYAPILSGSKGCVLKSVLYSDSFTLKAHVAVDDLNRLAVNDNKVLYHSIKSFGVRIRANS